MSFGLDYVAGPPIADLKSAGVTFVCRYLSEVNAATEVKLLTPAEAKLLGDNGIAIVSNYEWTGTTPLGGFNAGVFDAQIARDQHAACGGPADRPIYFSVDFGTTPAQMPAIIDYFKGVASVIGLHRTGAYGGYYAIKGLFDAGVITWGWQTYAWSAGLWDARAHIQQYSNGIDMAGHSVDYDRAMKPDFGQWIPGGTPVQHYTEQSADFGNWFTATDASHWKCKHTGCVVQFGIKDFYASLSLDGQSLPVIGLPTSDEINLTVNGKPVVLQIFERAGVYYDTTHAVDRQPGTGIYALCHLNDPDFLTHVPGLPQQPAPAPAPVDTSAVEADINAIADAIAAPIAKALADLKKL